MKRRDFFLGLSTSGAAPAVISAAYASTPRSVLAIEAPEDVQIVAIQVPAGPVRKGQLLFTLRSLEIETLELHLDLLSRQLDISERPFIDGRIDDEKELLKKEEAHLMMAMNELKIALDRKNALIKFQDGDQYDTLHLPPTTLQQSMFAALPDANSRAVSHSALNGSFSGETFVSGYAVVGQPLEGQITTSLTNTTSGNWTVSPDYKPIFGLQSDFEKATSEYEKAKMKSDQVNRVKQDAFDKIQLARQKIKDHRSIMAERKASMQISSDRDGNFVPRAMVATFVKRGHLLGELT